MSRYQTLLGIVISLFITGTSSAGTDRIWLVKEGKAAADIYAGAPAWASAEKLVNRIESWTGVKLMLLGPTSALSGRPPMARLLIGTADTHPEINRLVGRKEAYTELNDQGYLLRATNDPDLIILAGKSRVGTIYGLGELLNYRLDVEKANVWCEPFEAAEQPALPYRWLWLSASFSHWDARYGGPHMTDGLENYYGRHPDGDPIAPGGYPGQSMGPEAYRHTYEAMIDWMSEHKLNGSMIFGYIQSYNKGVEAARMVAHYGKTKGVDIIAGVGTMGYWGAYYGGTNEFNLDTLPKLRPEIYFTNEKAFSLPGNRYVKGQKYLCPSKPEVQAYFREAARWIAHAVPELGGLYLENGDLAMCPCEQCKKKRTANQNDSGCFYDMAASTIPFVEESTAIHPDWKLVYATYTSFLPKGLKTGTERSPPRFAKQIPKSAVCQWTVTGLNESNWPENATAPTDHSIGLFHSPSIWGAPDGKDRWWAGPGSSHDDASRLVRFYCSRMASSGFEGLVVKGMKNSHSPGPLLTYLALGEFSFHPERTMAEWESERLSRLFGGAKRAARYLEIARSNVVDAAERKKLTNEAQATADDPALSPRARPYWRDLADEMRYRVRLREAIEENPDKN